jgi:hypothetical protein
MSLGTLNESRGKCGKPSTEFYDDAGGLGGGEIADVANEPIVRVRQRNAGGKD